MELSNVVDALGALAQESRLAVFRLLVEAGPDGLAAGEIADSIGIPANTLSFHIKTLRGAGLVHARSAGRYVYYSANYDQMTGLLAFLTDNCCARSKRRPTRRSNAA